MALDEKIPHANTGLWLPEKNWVELDIGGQKIAGVSRLRPSDHRFIQVYVDDEPYLRTSESLGRMEILFEFLLEWEYAGRPLVPDSVVRRYNYTGILPLRYGQYEVCGMGWLTAYPMEKIAEFRECNNNSNTIDEKHLVSISDYLDGWKFEIRETRNNYSINYPNIPR